MCWCACDVSGAGIISQDTNGGLGSFICVVSTQKYIWVVFSEYHRGGVVFLVALVVVVVVFCVRARVS